MFQTMQGNARPHRIAEMEVVGQTQADLMNALQAASDNIMRLAGRILAEPSGAQRAVDARTMNEQHALADELISRLLAMPVAHN
ncbi:hypothetical protein BHUM_04944c [Candidatus Burkholderia humilis]|nr:hypothetical protein BHUM_04944c [Candidatus Burkholderia humilis]